MVTSFYITMTSRIDMRPACGRRAAVRFFFYLFLGLVWVCEIEISRMGKNNGNPDLVCEKSLSQSNFIAFSNNFQACHAVFLPFHGITACERMKEWQCFLSRTRLLDPYDLTI